MQPNTPEKDKIEEATIIDETPKADPLIDALTKKPNTAAEINNPFGGNDGAGKTKFSFKNEYAETKAPGEEEETGETEKEDEPIDPEELSDLIIDGFDGIVNEFLLPRWHERQLMSRFDAATIEEVEAKLDEKESARLGNRTVTLEFTPTEQKVVRAMAEVTRYNKKAPLTEKEKAKLKDRLHKYLKSLNWDKDIPPGWALLATVAMIEGKRIAPPLKNELEKLF